LISTGTVRISTIATFTGKAAPSALAAVTVFLEQPANDNAQAETTEIQIFSCIRHPSRASQTASLRSPRAARYPIPQCGARSPSASLHRSDKRRGARGPDEFHHSLCHRGLRLRALA